MASRSDFDALISAGGYPGWDQNSAWQDFQSTGGGDQYRNLNQSNGGGSSGGSGSSVSPADMTSLETQAYNLVAPYYRQLATEAQGDFTRAKQALTEDYQTGVKQAKQQDAISRQKENDSLQNALGTFGIDFDKEQEGGIDTLNQRGMATYQQGPGNTPNVLAKSNITANPDFTSTVANPVGGDTGRGGYELSRILEDQRLRQEAVQRSTKSNLDQLGLNLDKQIGTAATDANGLPDPNADRTTVGSLGQTYLRGQEDAARQQQLKDEDLAQQRTQDVQGIANQQAQIGARTISADQANQIQRNQQTDFINQGV